MNLMLYEFLNYVVPSSVIFPILTELLPLTLPHLVALSVWMLSNILLEK